MIELVRALSGDQRYVANPHALLRPRVHHFSRGSWLLYLVLFHCQLGGGDEVFALAACSDHVRVTTVEKLISQLQLCCSCRDYNQASGVRWENANH